MLPLPSRAGRSVHAALLAALAGVLLTACGSGGGVGAPPAPPPFLPATFQPAALVLGQADFQGAAPNAGGLDAGSVSGPTAAIEAGGRLWVADTGNHRVLGWAGLPLADGEPAVVVVGQPDAGSAAAATTATGMDQPVGLAHAGGRLYVAEFGNHRILGFDTPPASDGAPADFVLGQGDFTSAIAGTTRARLTSPVGMHAAGGRLVVADSGNHRVLVWNGPPTQTGANADLVLGQPDFVSGTVNAGNPMAAPSADSLNQPYGVWTDGVRLVVADRGNNRVLVWTSFPTTNGQPADLVLGQPDFVTATPSSGASGLRLPSDVTGNGTQLVVADGDQHRLLVWDAFPTTDAQPADRVLGQASFANVAPNDDDQDLVPDAAPSARTLNGAGGFLFARLFGTRLWVGDFRNNRVLRFDAP